MTSRKILRLTFPNSHLAKRWAEQHLPNQPIPTDRVLPIECLQFGIKIVVPRRNERSKG